jgi:hypothetical protein
MELSSPLLPQVRAFLGGSMREKRRHYLNKDSAHLRRMAQELARDEAWCEQKCSELDKGGAAYCHYANCAKANRAEIARIHEELAYRNELI